MKIQDLVKFDLPDTPGVYYFLSSKKPSKKGGNILYIGKATSLKDRVKSYFSKDILITRGLRIGKMLEEAKSVEYTETNSVLEALILEANEIKKYQPIYNAREKDDKSYNYITITEEDFPKILITRGSGNYGPFPHGKELREALKIIRRIFPYRDAKCKIIDSSTATSKRSVARPCFNAQIGLCPGPCAGWVSQKDYKKTIRHISLFFEAKKPALIKSLEKEMKSFAKEKKFEEAEKVKRQLFALDHIQDVALIKQDVSDKDKVIGFRIEAYDIAHISGTDTVGVMVVVEDGELNKSQYRKFKIRSVGNNDIANLKELLTRRFTHSEWRFPNLVVVDGGQGQLNIAKEVLSKNNLDIRVVSVVKDERHKAREIMGKKTEGVLLDKPTLLANSEAHRFAINFHRKLRGKGFRV